MKIIDEQNNEIGEVDFPESVLSPEDRLLVGYTYIGDGQLAARETYLNKASGGSIVGMSAIRDAANNTEMVESAEEGVAEPNAGSKPEVPLSEGAEAPAGETAPPAGVEDPNNATDNAQDPQTKQVRRAAK